MAKEPELTVVAKLEQKVAVLEQKLNAFTGHVARQTPDVQADYIEFGSDQHASHIGLRKAKDTDTLELDGWTLEDFTIYGPTVSDDFLALKLSQKVSELIRPCAGCIYGCWRETSYLIRDSRVLFERICSFLK